ncbi:phage distal tail protein [Dielma fastidiosa]|uniref:Tail protein n=1 Tax=Dielma fastidiosa TaxID=1034346 RepID=A0A318KEH5_9FIRM|nr:phage tail domain-containing protein [Dielma fastidiosa]PXX74646.1 tail protein [Dielma fastidiosa]
MKKNEKLMYTNERGESIEMSWFSRLICKEFSDELSVSYNTIKNANQDGETLVSQTFDTRPITIDCFYQVDHQSAEFERKLKRIFNPRLKGTLKHITEEIERDINVKLESIPIFKHDGGYGTLMLDFVAHAPFWQDVPRTEYLAFVEAALSFPLTFIGGMSFGIRRNSLVSNIDNVGDVDCGFKVTFKASGGTVSNPYIKKGDKYIRLNYEMQKGDLITVDMLGQSPVIYLNEQKDSTILKRKETEFFNLDVGLNEVEYNAERNVTNLDVIVTYRPQYL